MRNLLSKAVNSIFACIQAFQMQRFVAVALVAVIVLATTGNAAQADQSLGERMRNRVEQYDRNTERPKTTGQFLDEADQDIPLGERMQNIVRDSAEALNQFGKEYSVGAQESASNVKDQAAEAGTRVSDRVQR